MPAGRRRSITPTHISKEDGKGATLTDVRDERPYGCNAVEAATSPSD